MKSSKYNYLLVSLVLILILGFLTVDFSVHKIKGYSDDFEKVNTFILESQFKTRKVFDYVQEDAVHFPVLNEAIEESELCSIDYYPEYGIVYKFQCENNSSDNFFDSDDKYYLIKILNENIVLLSFEQFVDYAKSPIELGNDWYLIEQNIAYD